MNAFSQLVNVGTITRAALDATGAPSAACASVLRTVTGVWLLTWNIGDDDTVAVLEEVTAGQALELVWSMFRPAVA